MQVDLDGLRVLDAVVVHGSFAKAAVQLNRTQAAVSYKLKKLEEQLNVTIFNRDNYRAELTPAGLVILEEARRLIRHTERLKSIVQSLEEGWEAYLEIVVDGAMPMHPVMRTLKIMADANIPTRIQMKVDFLEGVQASFDADNADIMIVRDYRESAFHNVQPLRAIDFVLCVAREHPLAEKQKVSLAELQQHVKLTINATRSTLDLSGNSSANGERVFYFGDFHSKKRAVLYGLGYGWMPTYLVQKELDDGRIRVVDFDNGPRYSFVPKFVYRSNRYFGKAGQYFKQLLLESIAQDWVGNPPPRA